MSASTSATAFGVPARHAAELDVFLLARAFGSNGGRLFHSLPAPIRQLATDAGFAHFMLVFRDPSCGSLVQFDFGPDNGSDIALPRISKQRGKRAVPGEIREAPLSALPDCHLHIGTTPMTLQDIRNFNAQQSLQHQHYLLNENDCRHYINRTVAFATGQPDPKVCRALLRHKLVHRRTQQGRSQLGWQDKFILWAQNLTDVSSWPTIRLAGQTTGAFLGAVLGRSFLWTRTAPPQHVVAAVAPAAAIARPRLPAMAMRRAATAIAATAQAPPARAGRIAPFMHQAAMLSARARTSLHAAATSAAGSLRRHAHAPHISGGTASSLAAAAAGALRQAAGRGVGRRSSVAV